MATQPLVTVITPFFNTPRRYMQEAVESVLAQSFAHWELVLVDDGSTGDSTAFAREVAARDPARIRYLDHPGHENRGLSATRMAGVGAARGRYIAFLDADDVWLPRKLEEQTALMEAHPEAAMVYGKTEYWYSWTGEEADLRRDFMPRIGARGVTVVAPPKLLPLYLRGLVAVPCTCSILVRRAAFDHIGGFDDEFRTMYEDQVFYAKICLAAPVLVADVRWDRYRQHPDSMSAGAERGGKEQEARRGFLRWLERYLVAQGVDDREIWAALHEELARCDPSGEQLMPRGAMLKRQVRKFVARVRGHAL